jgi:HEAT repeat protein
VAAINALAHDPAALAELPTRLGGEAAVADLARLASRVRPGQGAGLDAALAAALARAQEIEARVRLLQALAARGATAVVVKALAAEPDDLVRALGLGALEHDRAAEPALVAGLADRAPRVRATAARVLGQRKSQAAAPALVVALEKDRWILVRKAAAGALGTSCAEAGRAALLGATERAEDDGVRRAALESLAACRDPQVIGRLQSILLDGDDDVRLRARAAALLAGAGDPDAEAALVKMAHDPGADPLLRTGVIEGLPCLQVRRAIADLARDPDPGVWASADARLRRCR